MARVKRARICSKWLATFFAEDGEMLAAHLDPIVGQWIRGGLADKRAAEHGKRQAGNDHENRTVPIRLPHRQRAHVSPPSFT